jgi:hypothetical protein
MVGGTLDPKNPKLSYARETKKTKRKYFWFHIKKKVFEKWVKGVTYTLQLFDN